jgi:hypothetical protein
LKHADAETRSADIREIVPEDAVAQKAPNRIDGVYDFKTAPHTGRLAIRSIKGGVVFEVTTVSPKGATCDARGRAVGGTVLTFREDDAGFRLKIDRDAITISGLLGRVADQTFCGLGAMLTGVYKRTGPLDTKTAASLSGIDKPVGAPVPQSPSR